MSIPEKERERERERGGGGGERDLGEPEDGGRSSKRMAVSR